MLATRRLAFQLLAACSLLTFAASGQAQAAENAAGIYLPGFRGPFAGVTPAPGLYFQNDLYLYGGALGGQKTLPFNGNLIADVNAKFVADVPTLLWSTPFQLFGGNLAFSASLPLGGPTVDAGIALSSPLAGAVIGRNLDDSIATAGDPLVGTSIGWHAGNFHWTTGVSVNVPIGDYREGAIANIAFHRWAADWSSALTWFDPKMGVEVSGAAGLTFNGTNPTTDYTTGTEFHLELAASKILSNQFQFGVLGYYYQQVTGDSGTGARLGDFKGRAFGIGGTAAYTVKIAERDVTTRVKVFREFDVENRLEGTSGFLTVSFPIFTNAAPAKPLVTKY